MLSKTVVLASTLLLCACAPTVVGPVQPLPDLTATLTLPDPQRLRVVVMGDQGTGTEVQRRVAAAMQAVCAAQGCDLGIGLGDNFYPAGPRSADSPLFKARFADLYGPLNIPFLMVPGNHDESGFFSGDGTDARGAEAQIAYGKLNPQWVMPGRTYRAPVNTLAEFFAVDTSPLAAYLPVRRASERPGGPWDVAQRAWLTQALGEQHRPLENRAGPPPAVLQWQAWGCRKLRRAALRLPAGGRGARSIWAGLWQGGSDAERPRSRLASVCPPV